MASALASCAPVDDTIGSTLVQPPPGTEQQKPVDAGDIAIVGQDVAYAIMDLPAVANATSPPMVQFTGVTSIIDQPIDTSPYTQLFRDRLILLTREKLRFQERTLPPLIIKKKGKEETPPAAASTGDNFDYKVLAELRGRAEDKSYKVQVQFIDAHSGAVLFNCLYRIAKEAAPEPAGEDDTGGSAPSTEDNTGGAPPPAQDNNGAPPPPQQNAGTPPPSTDSAPSPNIQ